MQAFSKTSCLGGLPWILTTALGKRYSVTSPSFTISGFSFAIFMACLLSGVSWSGSSRCAFCAFLHTVIAIHECKEVTFLDYIVTAAGSGRFELSAFAPVPHGFKLLSCHIRYILTGKISLLHKFPSFLSFFVAHSPVLCYSCLALNKEIHLAVHCATGNEIVVFILSPMVLY